MIVYLAGPITGVYDYKNKFRAAEDRMKDMGHIVMNPAFLPAGLRKESDYMDICRQMIDKCDAVYFLTGWTNSQGAGKEFNYANDTGKILIYEAEECEQYKEYSFGNTTFIDK